MNYIEGFVVKGKELGRTVDMPTANIEEIVAGTIPKFGVYAVRIYWKGKMYYGVSNVGYCPSVDTQKKLTVETNILDFDENIYGEKIRIEFVKFIRPTIKFANIDEVQKQVNKDKESVYNEIKLKLL